MDTNAPLVSVVMPVLDEERYIAGCLDSLLAQTWPAERLEILVVDGGSGDETGAIVQRYAARAEGPRVQLLANPKKIAAAAMNVGIANRS